MNQSDLVKWSRQRLSKGSKSFSFASLFFSPELRKNTHLLYSWCRYCDDVTDGSILGLGQSAVGLPPERVAVLFQKVHLALTTTHRPLEPAFEALRQVALHYNIPELYFTDMLLGMQQDVHGTRFKTLPDLLLYCYRVAGTVGLMMCQMTGLKSEKALKNAVDLGIALQLTNIARDIGDDYRAGRIYLPTDWLEEKGIDPNHMLDEAYASSLEACIQKLLIHAEVYYASGKVGLQALPFRAAMATSVAMCVYRAIGVHVLKRGHLSWSTRVSLSRGARLRAACSGVAIALASIPLRLRETSRVQPIRVVWRYS